MLKPLLFISAAIFIVLTFAILTAQALQQTAPAATPPPTTIANPVHPTAASQSRAKKNYANDCAMCHGDNGNGKTDIATAMQITLPDFTTPVALSGKTDGQLFDIIRNGAGTGAAAMPPEEKARASDDDVWNLVLYIRNLAKH